MPAQLNSPRTHGEARLDALMHLTNTRISHNTNCNRLVHTLLCELARYLTQGKKMPNLLQKRALDEVVRQYSAQYGLPDFKAFLFVIIERFLGDLSLNSIDIEESIVDGSDDCGIDAIFIDEDSESRPVFISFNQSTIKARIHSRSTSKATLLTEYSQRSVSLCSRER